MMLLVSHPPSARAVLVHHAAELAHVNGSLVEGKIGPFDPDMPDDDLTLLHVVRLGGRDHVRQ